MAEHSSPDKKNVDYWKNVASKLAISLAIVILAGGLAGSWMSSKTVALDGCREARKHLKNLNSIATEKIGKQEKELDECKAKIKELEQQVIDLKLQNANLKTQLDE